MPRYFFHLRNAQKTLLDCEGMAFGDVGVARRQAELTVRDFIQPATGELQDDWKDWSMDVCDERGRCVLSVAFSDYRIEPLEGLLERSPPLPAVVYIEVERTRRELASVEHQIRKVVGQVAAQVDRTRYETKSLYGVIRQAQEFRQEAEDALRRARAQPPHDWGYDRA